MHKSKSSKLVKLFVHTTHIPTRTPHFTTARRETSLLVVFLPALPPEDKNKENEPLCGTRRTSVASWKFPKSRKKFTLCIFPYTLGYNLPIRTVRLRETIAPKMRFQYAQLRGYIPSAGTSVCIKLPLLIFFGEGFWRFVQFCTVELFIASISIIFTARMEHLIRFASWGRVGLIWLPFRSWWAECYSFWDDLVGIAALKGV